MSQRSKVGMERVQTYIFRLRDKILPVHRLVLVLLLLDLQLLDNLGILSRRFNRRSRRQRHYKDNKINANRTARSWYDGYKMEIIRNLQQCFDVGLWFDHEQTRTQIQTQTRKLNFRCSMFDLL